MHTVWGESIVETTVVKELRSEDQNPEKFPKTDGPVEIRTQDLRRVKATS